MSKPHALRAGLHASCEEGWLALLDDCLSRLEAVGYPVEGRVREKMGVLQIAIPTPSHLSSDDKRRWEDIIRNAEDTSMTVCEICAAPGRLRRSSTGTWATRCEEHEEI